MLANTYETIFKATPFLLVDLRPGSARSRTIQRLLTTSLDGAQKRIDTKSEDVSLKRSTAKTLSPQHKPLFSAAFSEKLRIADEEKKHLEYQLLALEAACQTYETFYSDALVQTMENYRSYLFMECLGLTLEQTYEEIVSLARHELTWILPEDSQRGAEYIIPSATVILQRMFCHNPVHTTV